MANCPTCGRATDILGGLERLRMRADGGMRWRWFSGRMLDVMVLVGRGMTYGEAAEHLGVAEQTVKEYARRIRDRLGEADRTPRDAIIMHYREMEEEVAAV